MTPLERHQAMLEGRAVDHLPRIPILMQFAAQHIGASYADFCRDHRVKVEANLRCAADFGVDAVDVMSDPFTETQGFGAEIVFEENATPWCRNLPINILDVDHMVDMKTVRETLDPRVALAGNIDPLQVLRGRPEEIRSHVLRTYAEVGAPFFVNAGCEIPPGTPHENLRALCEPILP